MSNKILKIPKVTEVTTLSKSTIYDLVKKGEFPAPLRLTETGRASGWLESDIDEWINTRQKGGANNV